MLRRRGEVLGGSEGRRSEGSPATGTPAATGEGESLGTRFKMRQRFFTIGDRFFIENEKGDKAFQIENKVIRVRKTLLFQDLQGNDIYKIQEKVARVRDTMEIEKDGHTVAKVHNALITPLRDRWSIDVPDGEDLTAKGNILNHEYKIFRGDQVIGNVSKNWFRVRDTYGVDVREGEDALLYWPLPLLLILCRTKVVKRETKGLEGSGE
ncbi:LURP-one-related family protein [Methanolobus sp.]|uniref:LURP-one-related/scramblase family protein n=1 Tax=Methanolobus sp. TaxID=1874737 RepID=UPI0025DFF3F9|nr:LURP-one-related family protein [Methanolobus sp.]